MVTEGGFSAGRICWLLETSSILARAPLSHITPLPEIAG
jgi:hypothetical protein